MFCNNSSYWLDANHRQACSSVSPFLLQRQKVGSDSCIMLAIIVPSTLPLITQAVPPTADQRLNSFNGAANII